MAEKLIDHEKWIQGLADSVCLSLEREELMRLSKDVEEMLNELCGLPPIDTQEHWQDQAIGLQDLREDAAEVCFSDGWISVPTLDGCFLVPRILEDGGDGE